MSRLVRRLWPQPFSADAALGGGWFYEVEGVENGLRVRLGAGVLPAHHAATGVDAERIVLARWNQTLRDVAAVRGSLPTGRIMVRVTAVGSVAEAA